MSDQPWLFSLQHSRIDHIPDSFGYWFSGLTDGEGSFMLQVGHLINKRNGRLINHCRAVFHLGLRDDDGHVLEYIKSMLGCGSLSHRPPSGHSNAVAQYRIHNAGDLYHIIIPLFDKYPLQTKKRIEFPYWRQAVEIFYNRICLPPYGYSHAELIRLQCLREHIAIIRNYEPSRCTLGIQDSDDEI